MNLFTDSIHIVSTQDLWKKGRASEGPDVAFELKFSIRAPNSREIEAQWPADVVMRVFEFLDSKVCKAAPH